MGIKDRMKPLILAAKTEINDPALAIFRFRPVEGQIADFEAGQYFTIGDDVTKPEGTKFVPRPYSIASSPRVKDSVEFYIVRVDGGEFTTHLFNKKIGEILWYMGPKGKFTLDRTKLAHLVFIGTGTGIAPFVSMIRTLKTDGTGRRFNLTLMHGNRTSAELGYFEEMRGYETDPDLNFLYLPTVSRPEGDPSWNTLIGRGRVNDTLRILLGMPKHGKVDPVLPAHQSMKAILDRMPRGQTAFFLCGNPDMISDAKVALLESKFAEPDEIFSEDYW